MSQQTSKTSQQTIIQAKSPRHKQVTKQARKSANLKHSKEANNGTRKPRNCCKRNVKQIYDQGQAQAADATQSSTMAHTSNIYYTAHWILPTQIYNKAHWLMHSKSSFCAASKSKARSEGPSPLGRARAQRGEMPGKVPREARRRPEIIRNSFLKKKKKNVKIHQKLTLRKNCFACFPAIFA